MPLGIFWIYCIFNVIIPTDIEMTVCVRVLEEGMWSEVEMPP